MATKGHGVTLEYYQVSGDSSASAVGELVDITVPTISKDTIEITNHSSSGVRQYMGGLLDYGECTFTVNYSNSAGSNHTELRTLATTAFDSADIKGDDTSTYAFTITLPIEDSSNSTGAKMAFEGIVTSFELSTPLDDVMKASITVKVSGAVAYTAEA